PKPFFIDDLTGLFNIHFLKQRLPEELSRARRYGHDLTVMMTGIDNFNSIKENYGTKFSNYILKEMAGILKKNSRVTDLFVRYGSQEFFTVFTETDIMGAFVIAKKLRLNVRKHKFSFRDMSVKLTISSGLCSYPDLGSHNDQVVIKTVNDMFGKAKKMGGDEVLVFMNNK
ncbi:MAG: GGDEF domain-containing protein, partial [bacterium]